MSYGSGRVRVRVASSATGTGRVAEMVDPHTPIHTAAGWQVTLCDPQGRRHGFESGGQILRLRAKRAENFF